MDGRCIVYVCVDVKCRPEGGICAGGGLIIRGVVGTRALNLSRPIGGRGSRYHGRQKKLRHASRPENSDLDRSCHRQTGLDNLLKTRNNNKTTLNAKIEEAARQTFFLGCRVIVMPFFFFFVLDTQVKVSGGNSWEPMRVAHCGKMNRQSRASTGHLFKRAWTTETSSGDNRGRR